MQLLALVALLPLLFIPTASPVGNFARFHDTFEPEQDPYKVIDKKHFDIREFLAKHPYQPPREGDLRAPCPFLSTCANHGIIPRSGKNIHFESIFRCATFGGFSKTAFRISRATFSKITKLLKKQKKDNRPLDRISLDETGIHGFIEHDISFTRHDIQLPQRSMAEDAHASRDVVVALLKYATRRRACKIVVDDKWLNDPSGFVTDHECFITNQDLGDFHVDRIDEEVQRHQSELGGRKIEFTGNAFTAACAEANFLINMMGRHEKIPLEHAKSFLIYQKIPEDWKPPKTRPFLLSLGPNALKMQSIYRDHAKKSGTYKRVYGDIKKAKTVLEVMDRLTHDVSGGACEEGGCPNASDKDDEDEGED